jgi:hypothetical protein
MESVMARGNASSTEKAQERFSLAAERREPLGPQAFACDMQAEACGPRASTTHFVRTVCIAYRYLTEIAGNFLPTGCI